MRRKAQNEVETRELWSSWSWQCCNEVAVGSGGTGRERRTAALQLPDPTARRCLEPLPVRAEKMVSSAYLDVVRMQDEVEATVHAC